jgi:hypothetical protein
MEFEDQSQKINSKNDEEVTHNENDTQHQSIDLPS